MRERRSSPTAGLPAVTSSLHDLRDLAHRLSYSVGPLVGASDYDGDHGRVVVRDDGATPVEATAKQAQALTSFYGLSRTSAQEIAARGVRWPSSHGDGLGGGAPTSLRMTLALTECYQRAREEAVGCWGGDGVLRW